MNPRRHPVILIVDDDAGLARLIGKKIRREGYSAAVAHSGGDALHWLREHQADLMLLDLKLPDIEGKDLISRLAEIDCPLPFIIVTGQGDERVAVEMMKRGALDYLVKDAQFIEFVPAVVNRALVQIEREKKLAAAEAALRRSEANLVRAQEVAHVGSYEFDVPATDRLHWSAETFRILGLDPGQKELSLKEYLSRVVHPDDQARVREAIERTTNEGVRYDVEYRIVRPDGSIRHVHSMAEPLPGPDGKVSKIVGSLQDNTEHRQLEKALLEISDREQRRIGQDLHDGLGQCLAGIELMSQVLEQKLATKKMNAHATLAADIARHVREAISQTRLLARGLSPVVVDSEGLMSALRDLAASTTRMFRLRCEFVCKAPVWFNDHVAAVHLYRIAQEAVSNAIRHGKAKKVLIRLRRANGRIVLAVKDFGVGISMSPGRSGMGLHIMQYRAGMIGGTLLVQSDPGGGTSVICSLRSPDTKRAGAGS